MVVLDPLGDLIIILHRPNQKNLLESIRLDLPNRKIKNGRAASRRRQRRLDLRLQASKNVSVDNASLDEDDNVSEHRGDEPAERLSAQFCETIYDSDELTLFDNASAARVANEPALESTDGKAAKSNEQRLATQCRLDKEVDNQTVAKFRVSSSHLRLASPQFSRIQGTLNEQEALDDGTTCRVLQTEEWDSKAFMILLNVVHGHHRQVPNVVNLDTLGKLAVLVDYYECHERVELFAKPWITALEGDLPAKYDQSTILWLTISWVFSHGNIFKRMTEMVLKHSKCPFEAENLPFPEMLVSMSAILQC